MQALTEDDTRAFLINVDDDDRRLLTVPADFLFVDWDHIDFYAWRDPHTRGRGYVFVEQDGRVVGVMVRAAQQTSSARAAMCNLCHTMQPAEQVTLCSARKAGEAGRRGNSVGTYICADLSCHENVRLAAPLAPNELRASVDRRIDGTRQRVEAFVASVSEGSSA